jgi:hypothetical protein
MNKRQILAARLLTNRAERANRIVKDKPLNGVLTWKRLDWGPGAVVIEASNLNEERQWYESYIHVIAEIGPRGGIHIRHCTGLNAARLKR